MKEPNSPPRFVLAKTIVLLALALATGVLAWLSLARGILYGPGFAWGEVELGARFYMGISVYITISVTLFTSAAIRIALGLSK